LYFAAQPLEGNYDLYYSDRENGAWSEPMLIEIEGVNTNLDETSPTFSPNGKLLLFTRPVPEELKADDYCKELWGLQQSETGEWSEPLLLGPDYNTGCIQTPSYAADNKTFYYSTYKDVYDAEGKKISKNNFNLYWAKIDGLFQFKPQVIASILNDDEDLISLSVTPEGTAYYGVGDIFRNNERRRYSEVRSQDLESRFRPESMTLIQGNITDIQSNAITAEISAINPYTSKVLQRVSSDADGYYQLFVPSNSQLNIIARKQNYSVQSRLADVDTLRTLRYDFSLFPNVEVHFNVFDDEFFFPLNSNLTLLDQNFEPVKNFKVEAGNRTERVDIPLGKQLYVVFQSENYHEDTLTLPFDKEVIFNEFEFEIELTRKLKDVNFSFSDEESGNSLGLEVTVFNVTRNEKTTREVKDGKVTLRLRDGEVYEISTSAQGYSFYSAEVDLSQEEEEGAADGAPKVIEATLKSIKNTSIVLGNITFEYNSYNLTAESYPELDKLVNYLQDNEGYRVEIAAHTDDKGAEAYNLKLSRLRANSVMEYLQDNGILSDRLLAKGLGESQPLLPNDSEDNRAKNRRVEFKIIEGDAD
jgi:outer membrane protein OmpA-like peptidoglycan-associated protein